MSPRGIDAAVAIGIGLGVLLSTVTLTLDATHVICIEGPVIGRTGPVATPYDVELQPPGGLVHFAWWLNASTGPAISATDLSPENRTVTDFWYYNWSLEEIHSSRVAGAGSQAPCATTSLTATPTLGDGSSGCICVLAPPVSAGVGERLEIQQPIYFGAFPFVILNVTYGSTPIATFSWNDTGGRIAWTNPGDFNGTPVTLAPFSENGTVLGLGLTTRFSGIRFAVPISLTTGGEENVSIDFPTGLPNATAQQLTLTTIMTYILPAADDQGTWEVFLPGSGGSDSLQGLLFEQVGTS